MRASLRYQADGELWGYYPVLGVPSARVSLGAPDGLKRLWRVLVAMSIEVVRRRVVAK